MFLADFAEAVFAPPKRLSPNGWVTDTDASGRVLGCKITCDLFAEGVPIKGARLRCRVSAGRLHKASMLCEIDCGTAKKRDVYIIYRLDLNPTTAHSNEIKAGDVDSGRIIPRFVTHDHCFRDRVSDDRPDGFGRVIEAPLSQFPDAFLYFCAILNISNPADLPPPPIQGNLL